MPKPGIITGRAYKSDTSLPSSRVSPGTKPPRGIFAEFPGATPKYARNYGKLENYRESMARLFVQVGAGEYRRFIDSLPAESQPLAKVLAGTNVAVGGNDGGAGYIDFILQQVQQSVQEKVEKVEFLSDDFVVYYYGQSAPVFTFSGIVYNTIQDDQAVNLLRIYRDILRGTQLARRKKAARIRYDSYILTGYLDAYQFTLNADNEGFCPFSFPFTVKNIMILPNTEYGIVSLNERFSDVKLYNDSSAVSGTQPVQTSVAPAAGSAAAGAPPSTATAATENRTNTSAGAISTMTMIAQSGS